MWKIKNKWNIFLRTSGVLMCISVGLGMFKTVYGSTSNFTRALIVVPLMILIVGALCYIMYALVFIKNDE